MDASRNRVGPQVLLLCNECGWSLEKFASVCQLRGWDVSRGVIARIEGGVRWVGDFELLELTRKRTGPYSDQGVEWKNLGCGGWKPPAR